MKKTILISIALVVLAGVGLHLFMTRNQEHTDDAAMEAQVATISPRVTGYVTQLAVKDNQLVKAGTVLVRLDDRDYKIRLAKAQAAFESAQASLQGAQARVAGSSQNLESTKISAPSNLAAAQAQVSSAQASLNNAQTTLKRLQALSDLARSQQQVDNAMEVAKTARANLNDALARLRSAQTAPQTVAAAGAEAEAQVAAADAQVAEIKSAQADIDQAQKDLSDTVIVAPFDGRVTNRGVEVGNYVQPGQSLMSVVGNNPWVVANFKETQVGDMKPGQRVEIEIDAYKHEKVSGHVDSIQAGTGARFSAFPPQNATGNFVKIVQRVPVKIVLDDKLPDDVVVGPGMSVTPTVFIQ